MDEENLTTSLASGAPEQSTEGSIQPTPGETVSEIATEGQVETPIEPLNQPTIEEPIAEQPAPEAPQTEAKPRKPTISVQAELETPVEAPRARLDPLSAKQIDPIKRQKIVRIALIVLLVLALAGFAVWYFLLRGNGTASDTSIQNNVEPAPDLEPIPVSQLALKDNSLSDFDLAFLHLENKQGNVIYSPLSIKYALAMLADGANGRSREQITAVIGDYQPKAYLNSANRSLANAMFIRTDFSQNVKPTYTDTLKNKYYAEVIYDPFASPDNANKWVEDKTLGIIKNTFDAGTVNEDLDYMLVNALAIDMKWNNALQCDFNATIPYKKYGVYYAHENYYDSVACMDLSKMTFNGREDVASGKIATSANRYNIIKELGESYIRETVQAKYNEWLEDVQDRYKECQQDCYDSSFDLDEYIKQLSSNYNRLDTSTDFYFLDTDEEKVFAKDLQEYDGSTFQYVGIMPKTGSLNAYINNLTAEKASALISSLKNPEQLETFKEGVVTKLNGYIPFFKFSFTMDSFMDHLRSLGVTDVFSIEDADLSNMIVFDPTLPHKPHISVAIHKADIDFSNEGIKAAAVTAFGGMGAGGMERFDYRWDVPVDEIDLTFDKPFLFLIRDKGTGEVWFVGTAYEGTTVE
ncbi:hypothetical protein IKG06_03005 [Candidatus Saccharibacteria bacterium]|nr:hypothetical protein [Candidatus Saccharibacteria bacterium]